MILALRYIAVSMVTTICCSIATGIPSNRFFAILALGGLSYMAYAALSLVPRRREVVRDIYGLLAMFAAALALLVGWMLGLYVLWGGSFMLGATVGFLLLTTHPYPIETEPAPFEPEEW